MEINCERVWIWRMIIVTDDFFKFSLHWSNIKVFIRHFVSTWLYWICDRKYTHMWTNFDTFKKKISLSIVSQTHVRTWIFLLFFRPSKQIFFLILTLCLERDFVRFFFFSASEQVLKFQFQWEKQEIKIKKSKTSL